MEASFIDAPAPTPPRANISLKPAIKRRAGLATPAPPPSNTPHQAPPTARPRKLAFAPESGASWEAESQSLRANALTAIRQALGTEEGGSTSGSQAEAEVSPTSATSAEGNAGSSTSGPTLLASTAVMLAEAQRQEERESKRRRKEEKRAGKEKRKAEGEEDEEPVARKSKKEKKKQKEQVVSEKEKEKAEKARKKEERRLQKEEKERRKSAPASALAVAPKKSEKRRASAVDAVPEPASPTPSTSASETPAPTPPPPPTKQREKRERSTSISTPDTETIPTSASVLAKFMAQAKSAEDERQLQESADRAARDLAALAEREAEALAEKEKEKKSKARKEKRKSPERVATLAAVIASPSVESEAAKHLAPAKRTPRTRVPKASTAGPSSEAELSGTPADSATAKRAAVAERRESLREARNDRKAAEYSTPDLRAKLQNPEALNEFLAGSWIEIPVLQRLEADGIISYKRGKFTEAEKNAVRDHLEAFKKIHKISHSDLTDIMTSKGRSAERGAYPGFWSEIAQQVPGRPVRYVKEAVMRIYHPSAHKGKWTAEEDRTLLQAFQLNPNAWGPISESVGRTITDCRDRYRGQLRDAAQRKTGSWSDEEVEALTNAVNTAMTQLGADMLDPDVPWEVVLDLMGRTRTLTQCRKKWAESVAPKLRGAASKIDRGEMIKAIRKLNYANPRDIQWSEVADEMGVVRSPLSSRWMSLVRMLWPDGWEGLEREGPPMAEILQRMENALAERERAIAANGGKVPRTAPVGAKSNRSRAYIDDSDEDDYLVPHKGEDKVKTKGKGKEKERVADKNVAMVEKAVAAAAALDEDTRLEELALAAEEGEDDE